MCLSRHFSVWSEVKGRGESRQENTFPVTLTSGYGHILTNTPRDSWGFPHAETRNERSSITWWYIGHDCQSLCFRRKEIYNLFSKATQLIFLPSLQSSWVSRLRKAHILEKSDAPIGLIYLPKKKRGNLNGGFSWLIHVPLSSVVLDPERIAKNAGFLYLKFSFVSFKKPRIHLIGEISKKGGAGSSEV